MSNLNSSGCSLVGSLFAIEEQKRWAHDVVTSQAQTARGKKISAHDRVLATFKLQFLNTRDLRSTGKKILHLSLRPRMLLGLGSVVQ